MARKCRKNGAEIARKWPDCNIISWTEATQASPPSNIEVPEEQTGFYSDLEGDIKVVDTQNEQNIKTPQLALSCQEFDNSSKHHHVGYFLTIVFI